MLIQKAEPCDLKHILDLQYIAYQSEANLLHNFNIPPLKQTFEELEYEFQSGILLKAMNGGGNPRINSWTC